ncbi:LysR family transcriptional regulator [Aeromonas diversa CDC 2478-85]|uniref:LysR family transcriptional regulator n=1 Tax=Aeromonas diversa CDC 2478-85 TaxID=1268237 RepID=N9V6E8_9GAMM|nr:LysR family transcriptional regulator [Aeromonas diversa]ENY70867.1 LysR family transcriptional regulator [Aeromonas diversa CDC 2478-85]
MLLEGLETLYLLAREGTMGKVGSRLYISQSAVSKRIANLEGRIGKRLVEPDGRHIRLTADARDLLTRVNPLLEELKGEISDNRLLSDHTPLPLACSETLLAGYLAPFFAHYMQRQDSALLLSTHHTPVIIERVRSGDALLGICAGRLPSGHGLLTQRLMDEPFYLVGDESQALSGGILTMELDNPSNAYLAATLHEQGLRPRMQLDSYLALIELARAGVAPVLLPAGLLGKLGDEAQPRRRLPGLTRPLHLIYRPNALKRERLVTLLEGIGHHFGSLQMASS